MLNTTTNNNKVIVSKLTSIRNKNSFLHEMPLGLFKKGDTVLSKEAVKGGYILYEEIFNEINDVIDILKK